LLPGLYHATSTLSVATGNLTLDAADDSRAVWVFQVGSALGIGTGRSITLVRGALAANVFWVVGSSATIEVSSIMAGTVLADQSITVQTDAILNGRAFAHVAAVTLDTNTVVTLP